MGLSYTFACVLFCSVVSILPDTVFSAASKVQMRIVHDIANGYFGSSIAEGETQATLVARAKPANFSGPTLLKRLVGHCFNITIDRYRYSLCPFSNVTQHEVSIRWNAYQGVLGVWSHWKIENNTFASMVYALGDECGDRDRSVEVSLICGEKNFIQNVTEPSRCRYAVKFVTKLVCHEDAMLVYPRLTNIYQKRWDVIWSDYKSGYITEKGYEKSLNELLSEAGLTNHLKVQRPETIDSNTASTNFFNDLNVCNMEYESLKKEIVHLTEENDSLKIMLDLNKILNRTRKGTKG